MELAPVRAHQDENIPRAEGASVLYSKAKAGGMLIPCNPQLFYKQRAAAQVVIF